MRPLVAGRTTTSIWKNVARTKLPRFEQAAKTVVKSIATEASRVVVDRPARTDVRTRFYAAAMVLVRAVSIDQQKVLERSRRRLRWSAALAIVGLLGICWTLVGNGTLPRPW
jgi:hypothetical protein